MEGVSGVGFSFGVDRIYDVMDDLDLFPKEFEASTKVLLLNFDPVSFKESLKVLAKLRTANIKSEIYPDAVKIKKIISKLESPKLTIITSDYHQERVQLIFNEILEGFHVSCTGVPSQLDKVQLQRLIKHERKAINLIIKNGLYY